MSSTFQPFKEEHQIFRQQVRAFVENELAPNVDQWEEDKLFPNSVFKRAGELGIIGAVGDARGSDAAGVGDGATCNGAGAAARRRTHAQSLRTADANSDGRSRGSAATVALRRSERNKSPADAAPK